MEKKLLVAISNNVEHLFGVRFICSFFTAGSEHHITLFHVCNRKGSKMSHVLTNMWEGPATNLQAELPAGARRSIKKAIALLKDHNIAIDRVITKAIRERYGTVKDILLESSQGLYDAVVLGRRASFALQWLVDRPADETMQSMIRDHCCTSPLWICPDTEPGRKNVLVCLDGSENGYRVVDHVGYFLTDQDQHFVTLLHVRTLNSPDDADIFQRAETILHEHDIGNERIRRSSLRGLSIPGVILSEIEKGGYGSVAVGMHGQDIGRQKAFRLAGTTTSRLISKIEKAALWCCP